MKFELLVFNYVDPGEQEIALFLLALYGLGSSNDRKPLLNVLLCCIALLAEQVEVLLCSFLVVVEVEQQVSACNISGSIALCKIGRASCRERV